MFLHLQLFFSLSVIFRSCKFNAFILVSSPLFCALYLANIVRYTSLRTYRVFQKTDIQFYFWDNFSNSAPILTIFSLLQAEIYGA